MDLARIVQFHRKKAGLSRLELARLAGVGKTIIFDIENGKSTFRFASLLKIFTVLNITLDWDSPLKETFLKEQDA